MLELEDFTVCLKVCLRAGTHCQSSELSSFPALQTLIFISEVSTVALTAS